MPLLPEISRARDRAIAFLGCDSRGILTGEPGIDREPQGSDLPCHWQFLSPRPLSFPNDGESGPCLDYSIGRSKKFRVVQIENTSPLLALASCFLGHLWRVEPSRMDCWEFPTDWIRVGNLIGADPFPLAPEAAQPDRSRDRAPLKPNAGKIQLKATLSLHNANAVKPIHQAQG